MGAAEDKVKLLKQYVEESSAIVFFGGAGVSTESGIPDFRSVDGLYHQEWKYPPETIISHSFFVREPGGVLPVLPEEATLPGGEAQCGP